MIQTALDYFRSLTDPDGLIHLLSTLLSGWYGYAALFAIVFSETGLLVGFFLPGDSLLVTAGLVAAAGSLNIWWVNGLLIVAAVVGDSVGYAIGVRIGPRLFTRERSLLFNPRHVERTRRFYARHGPKTIVIARFVPIIRTFAPVVAGVGRMNYRRFVFFNVFGGVGWVTSMIFLGYALTPVLDPALKPLFGDAFKVQDHVEKVIILVVLLSISPGLVAWVRAGLQRQG